MSNLMFAYIYSDGERHIFAITLQRIATLTAPGGGNRIILASCWLGRWTG
jgi:hypothetical protein